MEKQTALGVFAGLVQATPGIDGMEVGVGSDLSVSITALVGAKRVCTLTGQVGHNDGMVYNLSVDPYVPSLEESGFYAYAPRGRR